MKKILFIVLLSFLSFNFIFAQNEIDALRYSYLVPGGTARYNAMGGSFGALGADLSTMGFNPASIGVYKSSEFTISTGFVLSQDFANINNNRSSDYDLNFNINNLSYLVSVPTSQTTGIKTVNIGVAYNRLNNFNENIYILNPNSENSFTDWLAAKGNRILYSDLGAKDQFYSKLAWETYLIDQNLPDTLSYISAFNGKYGIEQRQSIYQSGNQGTYDFAMSINVDDKVFIGGSLGIVSVNFKELKRLEEEDIYDSIPGFNYFSFKEKLETTGTGLNFKFGVLFAPIQWMRFGLGVHTPTFFKLKDNYSTQAESDFEDANKSLTENSPQGRFDYELSTPFRANASFGLILANSFLLNIDYEYLNYSKAKLRSFDYGFNTENLTIARVYNYATNLRLGLEYKLGILAFRAGAAYYDSPYKKGQVNEDYKYLVYSGGIGFRTKSVYFDIAYSYIHNNRMYFMYEGLGVDSPETSILLQRHRLVTSLGFKF